ncbi:MAG: phenylalanine--tRNA ligase subunit beta [Candidatus Nanoarchaeia archaeon]|nr:phenylalanine--tRNA ligase subunit beta [Candidatus Nanoarchaeia archaeon]
MPTIDVHKQDLEELVGRKFTLEELEESLKFVKGEIDGISGHELKIDIKATDRPDLWNVEGIARALRSHYSKNQGIPHYLVGKPVMTINVSEKVKKVRPCIAAAIIRDIKIDDDILKQLIQAQEKIAGTFGRRRREVAIGIFNLDKIVPPLLYTATKPDGLKFEPLDGERKMTPSEVLDIHPKGKEFAHLVNSHDVYPIIIDGANDVVSMPPIINSEKSGRVTKRSKNLLIEVTGLEMRNVETALNILAMSLADRGGKIEQVNIVDSKDNIIVTPTFAVKDFKVDKYLIKRTFGFMPSDKEIKSLLERSRYNVVSVDKNDDGHVHLQFPTYRQDIMHAVDVVEDMLMAYGFDNIEPKYPEFFTQGDLQPATIRNRKLREIMVGTGAQEISTFILTNKKNLFEKMNLPDDEIVEIANPVSSNWSVMRSWLTPSLVELLSKNTNVEYPQKIFELGQCVKLNTRSQVGSEDMWKMAYSEAGSKVNFTHAKTILQAYARTLGKELKVVSKDHPMFITGRSGQVYLDGTAVGIIGELHPQVLNNWKIEVPVVVWEIEIR